jgi:hypothetical protein
VELGQLQQRSSKSREGVFGAFYMKERRLPASRSSRGSATQSSSPPTVPTTYLESTSSPKGTPGNPGCDQAPLKGRAALGIWHLAFALPPTSAPAPARRLRDHSAHRHAGTQEATSHFAFLGCGCLSVARHESSCRSSPPEQEHSARKILLADALLIIYRVVLFTGCTRIADSLHCQRLFRRLLYLQVSSLHWLHYRSRRPAEHVPETAI